MLQITITNNNDIESTVAAVGRPSRRAKVEGRKRVNGSIYFEIKECRLVIAASFAWKTGH